MKPVPFLKRGAVFLKLNISRGRHLDFAHMYVVAITELTRLCINRLHTPNPRYARTIPTIPDNTAAKKLEIVPTLTQLQHLIGVKWLFGRLDSFFMGVVGTTDFIDPVAGMSR